MAQLTPADLPGVPTDPFAASGPLKYRKTGASYILYSVGPDGRDDGGRAVFRDPVLFGTSFGRKTHDYVQMIDTGDIVAGVNVSAL